MTQFKFPDRHSWFLCKTCYIRPTTLPSIIFDTADGMSVSVSVKMMILMMSILNALVDYPFPANHTCHICSILSCLYYITLYKVMMKCIILSLSTPSRPYYSRPTLTYKRICQLKYNKDVK